MDYKLVLSVEHLKELSSLNGIAEFYLILAGGLCRSGKNIHYDNKTEKFEIYNEIDDVWQSNLSVEQLYSETNIVDAINNSSFYYVGCQFWGI
jgi:hypothetical protein